MCVCVVVVRQEAPTPKRGHNDGAAERRREEERGGRLLRAREVGLPLRRGPDGQTNQADKPPGGEAEGG